MFRLSLQVPELPRTVSRLHAGLTVMIALTREDVDIHRRHQTAISVSISVTVGVRVASTENDSGACFARRATRAELSGPGSAERLVTFAEGPGARLRGGPRLRGGRPEAGCGEGSSAPTHALVRAERPPRLDGAADPRFQCGLWYAQLPRWPPMNAARWPGSTRMPG